MDVKTLAVVGAGQMGAGIAQVAAQSGIDVILIDVAPDLVQKGLAGIRGQLDKAVGKGKLKGEEAQATISRLKAGALEDARAAQYAVEAVTENEEVKKKVFAGLARAMPRDAVLATNTSSIPITRIATTVPNPERVIGMHFMNPVPVMQLVEIIRGTQTSDATYATTRALAERMGKTTVLSKDMPGFIVNRILIPLLNDCVRVLDEADVHPEDMDKAMTNGAGWPMGPCALIDLIGIDVHVHASEALHGKLGEPRMAPPERLVRMQDEGRLGRKSGSGFYTY